MTKKQTGYELERPCFETASDLSERHAGGDAILDTVAENTEKATRVDGVVVGRLTGFDSSGAPQVEFYLNPSSAPVKAQAVLNLSDQHTGRQVALMFESSDPRRPIIMGLMFHNQPLPVDIVKDGERYVIEADKEILMRCGKSSILLRENGEIEINGRDIMSRASRNHRLRGGTIHLN